MTIMIIIDPFDSCFLQLSQFFVAWLSLIYQVQVNPPRNRLPGRFLIQNSASPVPQLL